MMRTMHRYRITLLLLTAVLFQADAKWNILKSLGVDRDIKLHTEPDSSSSPSSSSSSPSFGVDVSFPMHYHNCTMRERPFGNAKQEMYEDYMQGCIDYYPDVPGACEEAEDERIWLNLNRPPVSHNYTETGFKKIKLPPKLWEQIDAFWDANVGSEEEEHWNTGNILANYWDSPTYYLDVYDDTLTGGGPDLVRAVEQEAEAIISEWTGQRLSHTSTYGVRIYEEGSILSPHVDRPGLVSSAIINVAQDLDEPWVLEVIDREGKSLNVTMEPGDMLLYESHSLIHGRPFPLKGRFMANMFVHFDPIGPIDEHVCEATDGSCEANEESEMTSDGSYGVDVSFPMHHHTLTDTERPFGDDKQELYDEFMTGCREHYGEKGHRCDYIENERVWQNFVQPAALENFTDTGYKKMRAPPELFNQIETFFNNNHGKEHEETWRIGDIFTNHWASPTFMLELGDDELIGGGQELRDNVFEAARPILEEWSGQKLEATHLFGVRIYEEGSILNPHVDREGLVISAIVNVAQDVDEPWMLEVIDRQGKAQNITMEPGDMVLYESRTLLHGRPFPLQGRYYANVFIHFQPINHDEQFDLWENYDDPDTDSEDEEIEEGDVGEEDQTDDEIECADYTVEYAGIQEYLNPELFEDPETLDKIGRKLREDNLVVIENAFLPEFADALHCDLSRQKAWELEEEYFEDGFHYRHHNIYDQDNYSGILSSTLAVFNHPDTKQFMSVLSGRDCSGDTAGSDGSPSYYMPGDHSLPHTDHMNSRTVAYVWHLSKDWRPEWGGALHWLPEHANNAAFPAGYNTLYLFSVRPTTSHFVTHVSPHATEKRLSFNGWWQSGWTPNSDDNLEEMLSTADKRRDLTDDQFDDLEYIVKDENSKLDPERRERLKELVELADEELWPSRSNTFVHKANQ